MRLTYAQDLLTLANANHSYRADDSRSATLTPTAIEDIPQSIFIITGDVIDDQAMTGLGELVRYVPGVTMNQGEGHRDAPTFRGNLTTSDFFVDSMRDDLQYLRGLYNVERVDGVKGASALVFGRGNGFSGCRNHVDYPCRPGRNECAPCARFQRFIMEPLQRYPEPGYGIGNHPSGGAVRINQQCR